MFIVISFAISYFVLAIFNQTEALVALPEVEVSVILKAESIIRNTTNTLFTTLKFQGKKGNSKLKRLSLIHSYLVTLALRDFNSVIEVAKLTRVDNGNDFNVTQHFIELLNENIGNNVNSVENNDKDTDDDNIVSFFTNYMNNIAYIAHFYSKRIPRNSTLLDFFDDKVNYLQDSSDDSTQSDEDDNDIITDDKLVEVLEVWKPNTRRIYQGKRTKIKHFPFMASVEMFGKFACGGSIIKNDLVITAASCLQLAWNNRFYRENPAFLSVRIGSTFFESGGEKVEVVEVFFHPGYDPASLKNNLAIMRLRRRIHFSKRNRKRVMKIDFDRNEHRLPTNTDGITVVGWGAKTSSNVIHNAYEQRLSYDVLSIYGLEECQDVYSKKYVTGKHFCAGFMSKGGGACNRDVGGPGVVDGVLTGVISFGSPICGTHDTPTVFTKVGFYADWIEEIMEQPIRSAAQKTTTKRDFDADAWVRTMVTKSKKIPLATLYSTRSTTLAAEPEVTTTESTTISEGEIKQMLKTIIKKTKKKKERDYFSSDIDSQENILKTEKKSHKGPSIEESIMNLLRSSQLAEVVTEPYQSPTAMDGVDPVIDDDNNNDHGSAENMTSVAGMSEENTQPPSTTETTSSSYQAKLTTIPFIEKPPKSEGIDITREKKDNGQEKQRDKTHLQAVKILESSKEETKKPPLMPKITIVNEESAEALRQFQGNDKEKSFQPDDIILTLLYTSDENEKGDIIQKLKNNWEVYKQDNKTLKFAGNNSDSSSGSDYDGNDDDAAAGLDVMTKGFNFRNDGNITTARQSLLSDKDIYEILSETLRENLNLTVSSSTKSSPE